MKWTLQKKLLSELVENECNPRKMTKVQAEHLQESISKFGLCEPIVVNTDNSVIGGHQRLKTLKKLGYKEVDVYVPQEALSKQQTDELNIRLNKNVGEWDFDLLANHFEQDDLLSWGFSNSDLHLEQNNEEKQPQDTNKSKMIITFSSPEQLQEAENRISVIVDEYLGATYKLKV